MLIEISERMESLKSACEKIFLIGCFYSGVCLLTFIISWKLSILLVLVGILLIFTFMISISADILKIQLISLQPAIDDEKKEEDERWRSEMP